MSPKARNPILAALVAGLSVSLAAPMAMAQGQMAQNCIQLPDGTRQCNGTGPQGQPPRGAAAQPGQGPGTFAHQRQPPRLGQQGQPPQGPGDFVRQAPAGFVPNGQPGPGPGGFAQPGPPGPALRGFVQVTPGRGLPEIGASARRAPVFQQAEHSRLPPPPPHQHYRVVDGTIVRVDDTTLQVVAIVGLLSAILNSN